MQFKQERHCEYIIFKHTLYNLLTQQLKAVGSVIFKINIELINVLLVLSVVGY